MKPNDFVTAALRSPLHYFMGDTMLISLAGRKTGKEISLPVNYYRDGKTLWILSDRQRTWWRNLRSGGEVRLHMHGQDLTGFGEAVLDEITVAARLVEYVRHFSGSAARIGLRTENGVPNPADLQRLSKDHLFVRVCLS